MSVFIAITVLITDQGKVRASSTVASGAQMEEKDIVM